MVKGIIRGTTKERALAIDSISNLQICLEAEHATIHDGIHFVVENFITLGSGVTSNMIIETPASQSAHFVFETYALDGAAEFEFRTDASTTSNGTIYTPINNNRISSNTSSLVFRLDPSTVTDGTLMTRSRIGSGTIPTDKSGGNIQRNREFILKPSSKYQIKIINQAGATNNIGFVFSYYEHNAYN